MAQESNDALKLLRQEQADNRSRFAQQQVAVQRTNLKRQQPFTFVGRDADSGHAVVSQNGQVVTAGEITSNALIKSGQSVRVLVAPGKVTVKQLPKRLSQPKAVKPPKTGGKIKYLYSLLNQSGERVLYVAGWKRKAVLVGTFPAYGFTASVDNLGGDHWSVNVTYQTNAGYVLAKVSDTKANDWQLESAVAMLSCAHGFWTVDSIDAATYTSTGPGAQLSITGSFPDATRIESYDLDNTTTNTGTLTQIWRGELAAIPQLVRTEINNGHTNRTEIYSLYTFDQYDSADNEQSLMANRFFYALPTLQLTNIDTSGYTYIGAGVQHQVREPTQGGGQRLVSATLSAHSQTISASESQQQTLKKINAEGTSGLGRKQVSTASSSTDYSFVTALFENNTPVITTTESNSHSDRLVWFDKTGIKATAPEDLTLNGISLDVFKGFYAEIEETTAQNLIQDGKPAINTRIRLTDSSFKRLKSVSVPIIYKPSHSLSPYTTIIHNLSYHP